MPERAADRVLPVRLQVGSYRSSMGSDGVAEWLTSLRSVRAVEQAATTHAQRLAAVHASGRLFAAAQTAGWSYRQLADATGMSLFVVKSRAQSAVSRGDPTAGLDIPNIRPAANGASPTGPSPWLSTQQVRAATGIGRSMLYRWRVTGLLPQARFTQRQWQYHRDDVDALIAMRGELKTLPKKTIQRAIPAPHLRVPPPASFQPQVGDRNKAR